MSASVRGEAIRRLHVKAKSKAAKEGKKEEQRTAHGSEAEPVGDHVGRDDLDGKRRFEDRSGDFQLLFDFPPDKEEAVSPVAFVGLRRLDRASSERNCVGSSV